MTKTVLPPPVEQWFDYKLLSAPVFRFDAERLRRIGDFIWGKLRRKDLFQFPYTIVKLAEKHKQFMDMYELAKIKEKEVKGKTSSKANAMFYRPRLANRDKQAVFTGLRGRAETSKRDRENRKV